MEFDQDSFDKMVILAEIPEELSSSEALFP